MSAGGQFSTPAADVLARLVYHAADIEGRRLRGWYIKPLPIVETEGAKDVPSVTMMPVSPQPEYHPNNQQRGSVLITIRIASKQSGGSVGSMEDIEKVIDALRISAITTGRIVAGQTVWALQGSARPFDWSTIQTNIQDPIIDAVVQLTVQVLPRNLGATT